jgi:hypothetical protein
MGHQANTGGWNYEDYPQASDQIKTVWDPK